MLSIRDIILRLRPCSWRYNKIKPELGEKTHFGFIAQDLLRDFGSKYGFVDETGEYLKVNYVEFIGPIVSFIQEQDQRIQKLEQELGELHEQLGLRTGSSTGSGIALVRDERNEELVGQSSES